MEKVPRVPRYSKELMYAVKYLMEKGFNTREISKRLDVSPNTVRNIKYLLRKNGMSAEKKHVEKKRSIWDILLG